MTRSIIVVGYELGAVMPREEVGKLVYPVPPSNYGEAAKAKWIEENKDKMLTQVHECKLLSTVEQLYAVNLTTKSIFDYTENNKSEDRPASAAIGFVDWLLKSQGAQYPEYPPAGNDTPAFYGFGPKLLLRALGVDAIRSGLPVPLSLWYANTHAYDPYEMLVEDEIRRCFPLQSFCRVAGVTYHEPGRGDCVADAKLVTELVTRYGLAPLVPEPKTRAARKTAK